MEFETALKLAIYRYFAETGQRPSPKEVAQHVNSNVEHVLETYQSLAAQRMLVLEEDGTSIRMASPFSGVPTQHIVESGGRNYYANCAWDTLGIIAALQASGIVHSRCEQSREPLHLKVGLQGPESSNWLFHCLVPAANWWDDIVFT